MLLYVSMLVNCHGSLPHWLEESLSSEQLELASLLISSHGLQKSGFLKWQMVWLILAIHTCVHICMYVIITSILKRCNKLTASMELTSTYSDDNNKYIQYHGLHRWLNQIQWLVMCHGCTPCLSNIAWCAKSRRKVIVLFVEVVSSSTHSRQLYNLTAHIITFDLAESTLIWHCIAMVWRSWILSHCCVFNQYYSGCMYQIHSNPIYEKKGIVTFCSILKAGLKAVAHWIFCSGKLQYSSTSLSSLLTSLCHLQSLITALFIAAMDCVLFSDFISLAFVFCDHSLWVLFSLQDLQIQLSSFRACRTVEVKMSCCTPEGCPRYLNWCSCRMSQPSIPGCSLHIGNHSQHAVKKTALWLTKPAWQPVSSNWMSIVNPI